MDGELLLPLQQVPWCSRKLQVVQQGVEALLLFLSLNKEARHCLIRQLSLCSTKWGLITADPSFRRKLSYSGNVLAVVQQKFSHNPSWSNSQTFFLSGYDIIYIFG